MQNEGVMNGKYAIGVDIGGSHIASAVVDITGKCIIEATKVHISLNSREKASVILPEWIKCISETIELSGINTFEGIGISMPGPANYEEGILHIQNTHKYDHLYGINLRAILWNAFGDRVSDHRKITFVNDANGFLLGEVWSSEIPEDHVTAITLGTGIGSGFMDKGMIVVDTQRVPPHGEVFNLPFRDATSEDYISTRWFLKRYSEVFGETVKNVKEVALKAADDDRAAGLFKEFGKNLGEFLQPILKKFGTKYLILGGNINKSYGLFGESFELALGTNPVIHLAGDTENTAILGGVKNLIESNYNEDMRETAQKLMPAVKKEANSTSYDVFPSFEISEGSIRNGFLDLATEISGLEAVRIDGYSGVNWDHFTCNLSKALNYLGINHRCYSVQSVYKDEESIMEMIEPSLGGDDAVFGTLFEGHLQDFIEMEKFDDLVPENDMLTIYYGTAAALCPVESKLIYIDVPKNEIQYRSRAGWVKNLGASAPIPPKEQYKRMFFVDWPVLNRFKQQILKDIDYIVDGQFTDTITWCSGQTIISGLHEMSSHAFRARPWFEPGVWGGNWIKQHIEGLSKDVVNYAWSFELIVPENGVVFSNDGNMLEVSFDFLMYNDNRSILGDAAKTFGTDFPIRFDFLDTFDGDNLSVQCHPYPEFIREQFGEKFTQDETYYILDAADDAEVYLGFKEDVDKKEFHQALLNSHSNAEKMDVERFVQVHPAKKHDLFLIPHGTIHCSGKNNLVLEISSTPYIYTFKMYDWMRLDLNGQPRPLNIERGMENLNFDCRGEKVKEEFISKPSVISQGTDWQVVNLSTHPRHFYLVNRLEFTSEISVEGNDQCHILSLVEGSMLKVTTGNRTMMIAYAETFVIPASAGNYTLENLGTTPVKVIQSYVKPEFCDHEF